MAHACERILVTGASGLVGTALLQRLLAERPHLRIAALVRTAAAWSALRGRLGVRADRVTPLFGDVARKGAGLDAATRASLAGTAAVVHCAADTSFSRALNDARAVNTTGTAHVLDLAAELRTGRFVQVSTAFVAGTRTGVVEEDDAHVAHDFVNAYEQSKHEAERLVRAGDVPWVILRPSTIVCDDVAGDVTQYNAVHRALRVFHAGLASLMPGGADTPVDLVTTGHVVDGIIRIGLGAGDRAVGSTFHLCAGAGAMGLAELLDRAHAIWSCDRQWRGRGIARPALTDLATYRLFEQSIAETGDARLAAITRSLSHFVPQLALPKQFVTTRADDALGESASPVALFWDRLIRTLVDTRWGAAERRAA